MSVISLHSIANNSYKAPRAKAKKKITAQPTFPTFHHHRLNIRKNGLGLHFLNQTDFSIVESLENFETDNDGLFSIRSVSDYTGLDYSVIRSSLNKLCNYKLLFSTVNMDSGTKHRIRYGQHHIAVDLALSALCTIRDNQYFGLQLSEQSIIVAIKFIAEGAEDSFEDMGEITSSSAPDLFSRHAIYVHAKVDRRFLTSRIYEGRTLAFAATSHGFAVYQAWKRFTSLVDTWQEKQK